MVNISIGVRSANRQTNRLVSSSDDHMLVDGVDVAASCPPNQISIKFTYTQQQNNTDVAHYNFNAH